MPVPIVTYHGIGDVRSPLWTPVALFEAHVEAFAASGLRTITMGEVLTSLRDGSGAPDDAVVITFDDGYESVVREAWPRLRERNLTATVYLVSDYCGRTNGWPGQKAGAPLSPILSWSQVERLAGEGCEFGGHTATHPCLPLLGPAAIEDEVGRSQEAIRRHTGQSVSSFAYPYGAVNQQTVDVVRRHCLGAVTTRLGLVGGGADPYFLPRVDAWYLRPEHVPYMRGRAYRGYLSAREAARRVRRLLRPDWDPAVASSRESARHR